MYDALFSHTKEGEKKKEAKKKKNKKTTKDVDVIKQKKGLMSGCS